MDCARLFFPPDAICATRDASGWNTDDPSPMTLTAVTIHAYPSAHASINSPASVNPIPTASA